MQMDPNTLRLGGGATAAARMRQLRHSTRRRVTVQQRRRPNNSAIARNANSVSPTPGHRNDSKHNQLELIILV